MSSSKEEETIIGTKYGTNVEDGLWVEDDTNTKLRSHARDFHQI
jgi:hypothetical protein